MTELVRNWITKAEHDLIIANSEMKTDEPARDMICYHFQQCAEKYLKAWLIYSGTEPRRTHNIHILLEQCTALDSGFSELIEKNVGSLTIYAQLPVILMILQCRMKWKQVLRTIKSSLLKNSLWRD